MQTKLYKKRKKTQKTEAEITASELLFVFYEISFLINDIFFRHPPSLKL